MEVLIVVAIIAVLVSIAIPALSKVVTTAKMRTFESNARTLLSEANMYKLSGGELSDYGGADGVSGEYGAFRNRVNNKAGEYFSKVTNVTQYHVDYSNIGHSYGDYYVIAELEIGFLPRFGTGYNDSEGNPVIASCDYALVINLTKGTITRMAPWERDVLVNATATAPVGGVETSF